MFILIYKEECYLNENDNLLAEALIDLAMVVKANQELIKENIELKKIIREDKIIKKRSDKNETNKKN